MTLNPINSYYLTDIFNNYKNYLIVIPGNLKLATVAILTSLLILDLTLMGKKLITDENFNPVKYLIHKTWQFSYLIFIILNYTWLISEVRKGFSQIVSLATGITINSNYLENPSGVVDVGGNLAWDIVRKTVTVNPLTWGYLGIALLILVAFCMIGFGLLMTWIEYYFLIGISIIFVPFGILETTEGYYKNIFKTIIGCNIKLFVMEFWLYLAEPIIKDLKITKDMLNGYNIVHVTITAVVLGLILLSLPSLASSMLTGSPAMSAGKAMSSAITGLSMAAGNLSKGFRTAQNVAGGALQTGGTGAKETAQGTMKGAKKGGLMGAKIGSMLGPVGTAIGGTIGAAAGATVGGAYSGAKFAVKTTGKGVKKAFGIKSDNSSSGTSTQEAVKNNMATSKNSVKETATESNSVAATTTGETRNNEANVKEGVQGDTTTVSSVDTGAERTETSNISESDTGTNTNKNSEAISTGETRNSVSSTSNEEKKSSEIKTIPSSSKTAVETKADTGEVRQDTTEKKQNIGEIKEPKYNFDNIGGTTKINGVEINDKKKK